MYCNFVESNIRNAKREGTYDLGIMELSGSQVYLKEEPKVIYKHPDSGVETMLYLVNVDRGVPWEKSQTMLAEVRI